MDMVVAPIVPKQHRDDEPILFYPIPRGFDFVKQFRPPPTAVICDGDDRCSGQGQGEASDGSEVKWGPVPRRTDFFGKFRKS